MPGHSHRQGAHSDLRRQHRAASDLVKHPSDPRWDSTPSYGATRVPPATPAPAVDPCCRQGEGALTWRRGAGTDVPLNQERHQLGTDLRMCVAVRMGRGGRPGERWWGRGGGRLAHLSQCRQVAQAFAWRHAAWRGVAACAHGTFRTPPVRPGATPHAHAHAAPPSAHRLSAPPERRAGQRGHDGAHVWSARPPAVGGWGRQGQLFIRGGLSEGKRGRWRFALHHRARDGPIFEVPTGKPRLKTRKGGPPRPGLTAHPPAVELGCYW
jgi:hypothetical protein